MTKRLLVLLLALMMMLSVAAPALAEEEEDVVDVAAEAVVEEDAPEFGGLTLGQTLTKDELDALLEAGLLKKLYAKTFGAGFEGMLMMEPGLYFDVYTEFPPSRLLLGANERIYLDPETGACYLLRWVTGKDGALKLQVLGVGVVDTRELSETELSVGIGGISWGHASSGGSTRSPDKVIVRWEHLGYK